MFSGEHCHKQVVQAVYVIADRFGGPINRHACALEVTLITVCTKCCKVLSTI